MTARTSNRRTRLVAVSIGLAATLLGCSEDGERRAEWHLAAAPAGTTIELVVLVGRSSCNEFRRIAVHEDADEVRVDAFVTSSGASDCTADMALRRELVHLDTPLGDRELVGCHRESGHCADVEPVVL